MLGPANVNWHVCVVLATAMSVASLVLFPKKQEELVTTRSSHEAFPTFDWYRPTSHSKHASEATADEYRPTAQSKHVDLPDGLNFPAGHRPVQATLVAPGNPNRPAAHSPEHSLVRLPPLP